MKRILYFLMVAAATLSAHATDYTDQLLVLVNGDGGIQQATISVNEHNGLYDLNLKNFVLMNGEEPMPVGNVELKDIAAYEKGLLSHVNGRYPALRKYIMSGKKLGDEQLDKLRKLIAEYTESFAA